MHANSVLWRVVFKELRALTNSKGLKISPTELNTLYEHLYEVGTLLQKPGCMTVFDDGYRPWPRVCKEGKSAKFYAVVDTNIAADLARLRTYNLQPAH